jgi:general secretion pathway protein I
MRVNGAGAARVRGFSLLEMVVAISVLSLALGMLYQAASGATRNVRTDEKYAYGVELARSLLADNQLVADGGVNKGGETAGGFRWQVASTPVDSAAQSRGAFALEQLEVRVAWRDGLRERQVVLNSVVPARGVRR